MRKRSECEHMRRVLGRMTGGVGKGITLWLAGLMIAALAGHMAGTLTLLPGQHEAWAADPPPVVCTSNDQCLAEEYCEKKPGDCQGEGVCVRRPAGCLAYVDPVCGCDGRTHSNPGCAAAFSGVNVEHDGECIKGDLNGDSQVTPEDALIAFRCYLALGSCPHWADVNQDSQITPADALCLFRKYLGLTSCLDWIKLCYIDFLRMSPLKTAEYLTSILHLPVGKIGPDYKVVSTDSQPVGLDWEREMKWIKEGYEYTLTNGGRITMWGDPNNRPYPNCQHYALTYLLKRRGTSIGWSYDQEKVMARMKEILFSLGIVLSGSEELSLVKSSAGPYSHWYEFTAKQKFGSETLSYPGIYAEIEGDTGEINFLKILRWYPNLNDITVVLSDADLEEKAQYYYTHTASHEVISVPADLTVGELYIIRDRLCKRVGGAVIDAWGSTLHLFIDVQTGDILDEERMLVDNAVIDEPANTQTNTQKPPEALMLLIEYEGMPGLTNFIFELQKRNIPSLLLASADFVEQHTGELKKLQEYGMEVAALCSPSPPLWDVPYEEQYQIIKDRKERIEACLGKPIRAIASAYFAYDHNTLKVAEELGIPFVMARGTTGAKATIYQPQGYDVRIFSVSNVSSEKWGTGSLCDYSYWAREGTPEQFREELFDAARQHDKISPVSHTRIGGLKAAWNAVYLDFFDQASIHWVDLDTFGTVDEILPLSEIPQNREVQYTVPKPARPLDEEPNVDNPCQISDFPASPGQGVGQEAGSRIIIFHNGYGSMCLAALDFLQGLDYPLVQHLNTDADYRDRLNELMTQYGSSEGISDTFGYLPVIFVKDKAYSGFDDQVKEGILQAIGGK
ncbi:MAG: polysaccharide deacetylase family protein [bacterium]